MASECRVHQRPEEKADNSHWCNKSLAWNVLCDTSGVKTSEIYGYYKERYVNNNINVEVHYEFKF